MRVVETLHVRHWPRVREVFAELSPEKCDTIQWQVAKSRSRNDVLDQQCSTWHERRDEARDNRGKRQMMQHGDRHHYVERLRWHLIAHDIGDSVFDSRISCQALRQRDHVRRKVDAQHGEAARRNCSRDLSMTTADVQGALCSSRNDAKQCLLRVAQSIASTACRERICDSIKIRDDIGSGFHWFRAL